MNPYHLGSAESGPPTEGSPGSVSSLSDDEPKKRRIGLSVTTNKTKHNFFGRFCHGGW